MYRLVFLILWSLLLFSCTGEKENKSTNETVLKIAPNRSTDVDFSDYFEISDILVLRQIPEDPIGRIDKIIQTKDSYYVLDKKMSNGIFVFDRKGNPIRRLTQIGRGPGEMGRVVDFDIIEEENVIVIVSINPEKQTTFSLDGDLLSEVSLNFRPVKFTKLDNGHDLYEVAAIKNNKYFHWGFNGKIHQRKVKITSKLSSRGGRTKFVSRGSFNRINNKTYCRPTLSNVIYSFNKENAERAYILDIGSYSPSYDKVRNNDDEAVSVIKFYGSRDNMIISYYLKGFGQYSCLLNTVTKEYILGKNFNKALTSSITGRLLNDIVYCDDSGYMSVISASDLPRWNRILSNNIPELSKIFVDFDGFKKKLKTVNHYDNILVKFKLINVSSE